MSIVLVFIIVALAGVLTFGAGCVVGFNVHRLPSYRRRWQEAGELARRLHGQLEEQEREVATMRSDLVLVEQAAGERVREVMGRNAYLQAQLEIRIQDNEALQLALSNRSIQAEQRIAFLEAERDAR